MLKLGQFHPGLKVGLVEDALQFGVGGTFAPTRDGKRKTLRGLARDSYNQESVPGAVQQFQQTFAMRDTVPPLIGGVLYALKRQNRIDGAMWPEPVRAAAVFRR